jgi:hypothetical protein
MGVVGPTIPFIMASIDDMADANVWGCWEVGRVRDGDRERRAGLHIKKRNKFIFMVCVSFSDATPAGEKMNAPSLTGERVCLFERKRGYPLYVQQ